MKFGQILIIILILAIALILAYLGFNKPNNLQQKNYCSGEPKNASFCVQVYQPVCGWFNSSVQCIKYPCANTYGNSCQACQDPSVEYWTAGECPQ